jgi:DNA-binding Lrp family transcriptional regulator
MRRGSSIARRRAGRANPSAPPSPTAKSLGLAIICRPSSPGRRGSSPAPEHGRRETAMKTIFVMVKCELGKAYAVADEAVTSVEQVSEVYSTSGQYDLLMKVYLPETADIGHFVTEQLQTLPGVKDTFTIIAFKAFSEDSSS